MPKLVLIRTYRQGYTRTMGMARQRLAEERDVAYARLEAAIRKAIGRKVRASTGRPPRKRDFHGS